MSGMAAWGTASTTMSPVTGLPVSEWRSSSTVLPPMLTRPEMAWPMLPLPMIVTCVMEMLPSGEVSCCYNWVPVPSVEERVVAGDPGLAEPGRAQVPVRADLGRGRPQVVPQVVEGRAAPEPVAVVDAVDDQSGLEHQGVRDHRVVLGVGVLGDVQVLLDDPAGVGQEGPLGADRVAEVLQGVVVVGGDGDDLGVGRRELGIVGGQFQVLVVFLGAVVAAGQGQDHRVAALQFAERADGAGVVGQRVVGEGAAGGDVRTHGMTTSYVAVFGLPWWLCPATAQNVSSRAWSSSRPMPGSVGGLNLRDRHRSRCGMSWSRR